MRPHSDNFHRLDVVEDLINQAMLDVDSSRINTSEIAYELFVWRRVAVWVFSEQIQQAIGLRFKTGLRYFLRVFFRLLRENQSPTHQPGSSSHFSTGVFSPFLIDSRIPCIEARYKVSSIARQSSSEIRTAEFLLPTI